MFILNKQVVRLSANMGQLAVIPLLTLLNPSAQADTIEQPHSHASSMQSTSQTDALIQQAHKKNLATHPTWLRLHFYKEDGVANNNGGKANAKIQTSDSTYLSSVEAPRFFISPNGNKDPQAELEYFIRAIVSSNKNRESIICQFPARTHWIMSQLGLNDEALQASCPEFEAWMNELDPQRLSVVFAKEYPDTPVSAFGHTLMLIDSTESLQDPTAIDKAYALNDTVAGDPDDPVVVYGLKSAFGGYLNDITIDPYPQKLADYLQRDNRDVWTYPIDLSHTEVQQIMRHVWETKDLELPYYFLKDNCASEILRYIDIVRPDGHLLDEFKFAVIPANVVRLLKKEKLITSQQYLPADNTLAQARLNRDKAGMRSETLPQSKISADNKLIPTDLIPVNNNPLDAHELQQATIGIGQQGDTDYLTLGYRYGFNDLLNRPDGYPENFDMQALGATIRVYNDANETNYDKVEIENIIVLKGRSFNPINTAYSGTTWGINLGAEQVQDGSIEVNSASNANNLNNNLNNDQSHLVANIGYERGVSMAFGKVSNTLQEGSGEIPPHLCYALGVGTAQVGKGISNGFRIGVGANVGCRYQLSDKARMTGEVQLPYWYHGDIGLNDTQDNYFQPIISLGAQYDIDKNQALRLQGNYQLQDRIDDKDDIQLAYIKHF